MTDAKRRNDIGIGEPRHDCASFVRKQGGQYAVVPKSEFDELCKAGQFRIGPHQMAFGDGYGDPYYPYRQAFGRLKDGRVVVCELYPAFAECPLTEAEK